MFNFFSLVFILKLEKLFRNEEIFIISLFSKVQKWGLGVKKFFLKFLVNFLPLRSGSVDLNIFEDPAPGSHKLTDPDQDH